MNDVAVFRPVRFIKAPKQDDYAVYFTDSNYYGADEKIGLVSQGVRIELYTRHIDSDSLEKIRKNMIALNIEFDEMETIWLNTEQIYMTTFMFDHVGKIDKNGGIKS